jgi:hypothetical protein
VTLLWYSRGQPPHSVAPTLGFVRLGAWGPGDRRCDGGDWPCEPNLGDDGEMYVSALDAPSVICTWNMMFWSPFSFLVGSELGRN